MDKRRTGSVILWLLLAGLVAFVLFNVVSGTNFKGLFKLPVGVNNIQPYERTPAGPVPMVDTLSRVPAPIGFTNAQLSPFYKQVRIDSVIRPDANSYYSSGGQFAVYADWSLKQPIDVTGWSVRGNKGNAVTISQAIADYNPNTFSTLQNSDVILESGGRVYVYGWKSVFGKNLRLNKCTGYLNENYKFDPSLPNDCPRVDSGRLVLLSGKCQDFVRSMNTCVTPRPDDLNRISGFVEDECRALINKQNLVSCYDGYHNEANFFSKEWRIWNSDPMTFDTYHDRLVLFDKNGLVVDEYTY